jgi:hypothetical protein
LVGSIKFVEIEEHYNVMVFFSSYNFHSYVKRKKKPAINLDIRFSGKVTKRGNDVALEDWGVFKECASGCDPSITPYTYSHWIKLLNYFLNKLVC